MSGHGDDRTIKTVTQCMHVIKDAISGKLAAVTGVSRQALVKYLKSEWDLDNPAVVKAALRLGLDEKVLVQKGQSFQLYGGKFQEPPGVRVGIEEKAAGSGPPCVSGDTVTVSYIGKLESDGSQFDADNSFSFVVGEGEVIKGWDMGVLGMAVGARRILTVPSKLGYGKRGSPPEIPGEATLIFDITLKSIMEQEEQ